ncbi:phage shock protein PspA [Teredinibacter sp. KSP-S5-2]|uniref:phage shock protein PspA n=1 Tax=Teredinibacter sp. KSP-S5-2 TaxID=3034506 RepID=UPI002934FC79|nr:phage shock protein PspA [Teredinibacter sp. KSP-S5-2]WNO09330.1 phage shock protein PspA [Teredinibacter sp. KSP-S5-2]
MGIFSRFSDIVQANINAMLDRAEDPQKMIRLMIQEMEETLIEVRSSCARVIADQKTTQRRLVNMKDEAQKWEEKAKLAITKGREDLARAALLEKQSIIDEVDLVSQELDGLDAHLDKLDTEIGQLQAKLNDAKAKEKAIKMREQTVQARLKTKRQHERCKVEDAFAKFEQYERRMDLMESEADAMDVGRTADQTLKQQFAELENDEKINSELNRLKADLSDTKNT